MFIVVGYVSIAEQIATFDKFSASLDVTGGSGRVAGGVVGASLYLEANFDGEFDAR